MKKYNLLEIAEHTGGTLIGDKSIEIIGVRDVETVKTGQITFCDSKRYLEQAEKTEAAALIIPEGLKTDKKSYISVKNPKYAFAKTLELFSTEPILKPSISKTAIISESAIVGKNAFIGNNVIIEDNVKIGENAVIYHNVCILENTQIGNNIKIFPNVTIYNNTVIGNNVRIHANAVIGADGFGYAFNDGIHYKVPQIGYVEIGNDVELGAHVSIDCATIQKTKIGNGVKIDNHVHLAHNVEIGDNTVLVSNVGVAGSSKIGSYCILAGRVGVRDHIKIGDRVMVGAMSGVTKNIKEGSIVSGFPAKPHNEEKKIIAATFRLPQTLKSINAIQKSIGRLARRIEKIEENN